MEIGDVFKVIVGCGGLGITYFFGKIILSIFIIGSSGITNHLISFSLLCLLILGVGIFSTWIILEGLGIINKKKVKKEKKEKEYGWQCDYCGKIFDKYKECIEHEKGCKKKSVIKKR